MESSHLLFHSLMLKLGQSAVGLKERPTIERELAGYLTRFDLGSGVMPMLLKEGMWGCVAVVLGRSPTEHSASVARALTESYAWSHSEGLSDFHFNALLKCLGLLDWTGVKSVGASLVSKVTGLLPFIRSANKLARLVRIADKLSLCLGETAVPFYLLASMQLLELRETGQPDSVVTPREGKFRQFIVY